MKNKLMHFFSYNEYYNVKKLEISGDKFSVENISEDVRIKLDSVLRPKLKKMS